MHLYRFRRYGDLGDFAGRDRSNPVSYTHLDVYKRQALVPRVLQQAFHLMRSGRPGPVPVSYTHLDSIAGPSEILVLADETANPRYVAADLLSQA